MGEVKAMKELEQWEKTQFILAGISRLCAACKREMVEEDKLNQSGSIILSQHCRICWQDICLNGNACKHSSTYRITPKRN